MTEKELERIGKRFSEKAKERATQSQQFEFSEQQRAQELEANQKAFHSKVRDSLRTVGDACGCRNYDSDPEFPTTRMEAFAESKHARITITATADELGAGFMIVTLKTHGFDDEKTFPLSATAIEITEWMTSCIDRANG